MGKYNHLVIVRIDDESQQLLTEMTKKEVADQSEVIRDAISFYCNYKLNDCCNTNLFKRTISFQKIIPADDTDRK